MLNFDVFQFGILKNIYAESGDDVYIIVKKYKHITGNHLLTAVLALHRLHNECVMPRRLTHRTTYSSVDAGLNLFNELLILKHQHAIHYRSFVTREPCENKDTVRT